MTLILDEVHSPLQSLIVQDCSQCVVAMETSEWKIMAYGLPKLFEYTDELSEKIPIDDKTLIFPNLEGIQVLMYCYHGKWKISTNSYCTEVISFL